MKILNADKLLRQDKKIILDSREYLIPADLPVKIVLKMMHLGQEMSKDSGNHELLAESVNTIFQIFKLRQPALKEEEFNITMEQYIEIAKFIGENEATDDSEGKQ